MNGAAEEQALVFGEEDPELAEPGGRGHGDFDFGG